MAWLIGAVLGLCSIAVIIAVLNRFYRKGSRDRALIRTGAGGQKIVMDAGCLVLPFLHEVEEVDMRTFYIDSTRRGESSLLTSDRLRVDVSVAFHIRVTPTIDGIATAAQTIGARSLSSDRLAEFLQGRFFDALQSVTATRTMDEFHENRPLFAAEVAELLKPGLDEIGIRLESVSVVEFDQTPMSALDENNAFNAVGMRHLTEIITTNRRKRKEIEASAETAIRRTELENRKSQIALELEREEAESEKIIRSEQLNARSASRTAEEREQAQSVSELARVNRESQLRRAEIERDQQLRKEEIAALQLVEEARINSHIELAQRRTEESAALAESERSKSAVITAEEAIKHEQKRLAAESDGLIAALKAEQDSAVELERARGNAAAAAVTAENDDRLADLENERNRKKASVEVERRSALIQAENEISTDLKAMKLEEQRLRILPEMAANMSRPLEKIDKISISHIAGLSRESKDGASSSGLGSAVDDVLDLAFRLPAVRKLGEVVGAEVCPSSSDQSQPENKKIS